MTKVNHYLSVCVALCLCLAPLSGEARTRKKRRPSQVTNQRVTPAEVMSQKGFKQFKTSLSEADTPQKLQQVISTLPSAAMRNKLSGTTILAQASLQVTEVFRGLFFRMRSLVKGHNLSQSAVVTALRFSASGVENFLPSENSKTAFDYVVQPYYNAKSTKGRNLDIKNDEDFKQFLVEEVKPAILKYSSALDKLIEKSTNESIYWDNQVLNKNLSAESPERFIEVGEIELKLAKAGTLAALASIHTLESYSLSGLFALLDEMAKKYGIGAAFNPGNSLSKSRTNLINSYITRNKFLMRPRNISEKDLKANLKLAYDYSMEALELVEEAWGDLKSKSDYEMLIVAQSVLPFSRVLDASLKNIKVVTGKDRGKLVSAISLGESITFDAKKFFIDEPILGTSTSNFAQFLPTQHIEGSRNLTVKVEGTNVKYRNYHRGRPSQWNSAIYEKYFGTSDVPKIARVLGQSWGTAGFAGPLALVLF